MVSPFRASFGLPGFYRYCGVLAVCRGSIGIPGFRRSAGILSVLRSSTGLPGFYRSGIDILQILFPPFDAVMNIKLGTSLSQVILQS